MRARFLPCHHHTANLSDNRSMPKVHRFKEEAHFEVALNRYVEAINENKIALALAVHKPSEESDSAYDKAAKAEKAARKAYKKATKAFLNIRK